MHPHHKLAWIVIATACVLDFALGCWFSVVTGLSWWRGVSYALGVATTSGSLISIKSVGWQPVVIQDLMQMTIIPLFAFSVSLVTSALSAVNFTRFGLRRKE